MQRPRSSKTRCSAAAAEATELEQQKGDNGKDLGVAPIYKGGLTEEARETRRPGVIIQLLRRLDFRNGQ